MKAQIRIISQTQLADPKKLPVGDVRLKVYGSAIFNMPEPIGYRDWRVRMMVWLDTYANILKTDSSAVLKITPDVVEPELAF